jgi:hypothetical protein
MNKIIFLLVGVFFLSGCVGDNSSEQESIPSHLRENVESFIDHREALFGHEFETYEGIEWQTAIEKFEDSMVYPFNVMFEREGTRYPFEHKAIVCADTLNDIIRFNHLFNGWESIYPQGYNVKDQVWWSELIDSENIHEIHSDQKYLTLVDTSENKWIEYFTGNVVVTFGENDSLFTDTLIWNPSGANFQTSKCTIKTYKDSNLTQITGSGLGSDAEMDQYVIHSVLSTQVLDPAAKH